MTHSECVCVCVSPRAENNCLLILVRNTNYVVHFSSRIRYDSIRFTTSAAIANARIIITAIGVRALSFGVSMVASLGHTRSVPIRSPLIEAASTGYAGIVTLPAAAWRRVHIPPRSLSVPVHAPLAAGFVCTTTARTSSKRCRPRRARRLAASQRILVGAWLGTIILGYALLGTITHALLGYALLGTTLWARQTRLFGL